MAALCKPETQVIDRSGPLPGRLVLERDEEVGRAQQRLQHMWTPTTSRPRAFLIMIGGANQLPKELDSGNKASHRAAVPASDESESDSSPVLPSDRDNNNVFVQPGASPSGFAVAGPE
ncbi:hypothetical protein MRX96_012602 [Rhipicephalus microplus]